MRGLKVTVQLLVADQVVFTRLFRKIEGLMIEPALSMEQQTGYLPNLGDMPVTIENKNLLMAQMQQSPYANNGHTNPLTLHQNGVNGYYQIPYGMKSQTDSDLQHQMQVQRAMMMQQQQYYSQHVQQVQQQQQIQLQLQQQMLMSQQPRLPHYLKVKKKPLRDRKTAPANRMSVDLINTYKFINQVSPH